MSHDRGCPCGRERDEYDECSKSDCYKRETPSVKPTFNSENLKVGDVFYSVKERNTAFHRKKIHKEIDGEDWFKYDRPLRTYEIVTHTVLGILRKELEGDWTFGESVELETGFVVRSQDETHVRTSEFYFDENKKYFVDIDEAMVYKETMELAAKELDKT